MSQRSTIDKKQYNIFFPSHPRTMGNVSILGQRLFIASRSMIPVPTQFSSSFLAAGPLVEPTGPAPTCVRSFLRHLLLPLFSPLLSPNRGRIQTCCYGLLQLLISKGESSDVNQRSDIPRREGDNDWAIRDLGWSTLRQSCTSPPRALSCLFHRCHGICNIVSYVWKQLSKIFLSPNSYS